MFQCGRIPGSSRRIVERSCAHLESGRSSCHFPPAYFIGGESASKGIRAFMTMFGKDKFTYLSLSRLEISPRAIDRLFQEAGFSLIRLTRFDPVLPRALLRIVRPSLLVVEVRKLDRF